LKLNITVDGKKYEVEVEVAEDDRLSSGLPQGYYGARPTAVVSAMPMPLPLGGGSSLAADAGLDEEKVCRSPIAGVVVRVNVQVGQQIQLNDTLLVLEAMKMETNISAPGPGKIKEIRGEVGTPVTAGQVVVVLE
jgi:methylmalonyl-CoA carboxyltransferase small subunit